MKRCHHLGRALLSLCLFAGLCSAQDADKDAAAAEALAAIEAYDKDTAAFREKVMKVPPAQRREMMSEQPSAAAGIEKANAFVTAAPEHDKIPQVALWLVIQQRGKNSNAIYDLLLKHHLDHPDLASTCIGALYDRNPEATVFLETVLEKADQPQAKAAAAYGLAQKSRSKEDQEKRLKYLQMAVKDLGDLEIRGRKLKARAEGELFAAENLVVGKTAPEIEGEDLEGTKFKLSDYRGKVVVLDFWGDW